MPLPATILIHLSRGQACAMHIEPVVPADIAYSALTAEKRLRAPVFKGIREDLLETKPGRTQREAISSARLRLPPVPPGVHRLEITKREGGIGTRHGPRWTEASDLTHSQSIDRSRVLRVSE